MERVDKRYSLLDNIYIREKYMRDTLIMDSDGVLLLVKDGKILFDKFGYRRNKNEVGMRFNYNKIYLIFKSSLVESDIMVRVYMEDEFGSIVNEYCLEPKDEVEEAILSRNFLMENFSFDDKKMDGLYVIDLKKGVLSAQNGIDGVLLNNFVIPSDDEICEMEYEFQKQNHRLFNLIRGYDDGDLVVKKKIEDIKYYPIVQGVYYHCQNYLYIMVKDGNFDIYFFEVVCMGKDKFKLVSRKVLLPKENVVSNVKTLTKKKIM